MNRTIVLRRRRTLIVLLLLLLALAAGVAMLELRLGAGGAPAAPTITSAPLARTSDPHAVFAFEGDNHSAFECALDSTRFAGCSSPVDYGTVSRGGHTFLVRAVGRSGAVSDSTAWKWTVTDETTASGATTRPLGDGNAAAGGESFAVHGGLVPLLTPGTGGPLRLAVGNPHSYPIEVTSIVVSVGRGSTRAGCDGRVELAVTQSNLGAGGAVLRVPAHATVTLPARGVTAPFVRMRNRPVNQDACKHARFALSYAGTARRARGG